MSHRKKVCCICGVVLDSTQSNKGDVCEFCRMNHQDDLVKESSLQFVSYKSVSCQYDEENTKSEYDVDDDIREASFNDNDKSTTPGFPAREGSYLSGSLQGIESEVMARFYNLKNVDYKCSVLNLCLYLYKKCTDLTKFQKDKLLNLRLTELDIHNELILFGDWKEDEMCVAEYEYAKRNHIKITEIKEIKERKNKNDKQTKKLNRTSKNSRGRS